MSCDCDSELARVMAMQSPATCAVMGVSGTAAAPSDFDDLCNTLLLLHRIKRANACKCAAKHSRMVVSKLTRRVLLLCERANRG